MYYYEPEKTLLSYAKPKLSCLFSSFLAQSSQKSSSPSLTLPSPIQERPGQVKQRCVFNHHTAGTGQPSGLTEQSSGEAANDSLTLLFQICQTAPSLEQLSVWISDLYLRYPSQK